MADAPHIELGKQGEELAAQHLIQKGYEILHRNWRNGRSEVDIIARVGNDWVFVEVKTRETDYFGYPEEAVDKAKQKQLQKAANAFVEQYPVQGDIRFDIVAIVLNGQQQEIYHIEDAFWPMDF